MEATGLYPARARWHHDDRTLLPQGKSQMALQEGSPREGYCLTGACQMQVGGQPRNHPRDG